MALRPAWLLSQTHTQCPSHSLTHSLKHLFIYQLNNFFTQSLAYSFMHSLIHSLLVHLDQASALRSEQRDQRIMTGYGNLRVRHLLKHMYRGIFFPQKKKEKKKARTVLIHSSFLNRKQVSLFAYPVTFQEGVLKNPLFCIFSLITLIFPQFN